jgi:two-component system sensor histidine kinase YesM
MASEQVERIYRYLGRKEELGERVGIHNVIHRLRMLYDDKFQLLIDSKQGEGTLVQITIPVEMDPKVPDALSMES